MNTAMLLTRTDELIKLGDEALKTEFTVGSHRTSEKYLESEPFSKFRAASISFIFKLFDEKHPYYLDYAKYVEVASPSSVKRGKGVLAAIRKEIEDGWLNTAKGLISADIFLILSRWQIIC